MQFSNKGRDKVLAALKGLDGLPYPFHTQVLNQFIDDFADADGFLDLAGFTEGWVRAWEALPENLRTIVPNLESVSRFLSARNIDPVIFKNEISSLGDFQDDFIRSLDNATATTPYPRITNKEIPDTDGSLLGRFENGVFVRDPSSNAQVAGTWDYVVKLDGEIVVGRKHSWLSNGGEDVLAAGELKWNNGAIVDINNSSGHYRPTPGEGFNFLRLFNDQGIDVNNAWLTLRVEDGPINYPIFNQISPNGVARSLYE